MLFVLLNNLQYRLQKPWRFMQRSSNGFSNFLFNRLWPVPAFISFFLYLSLTPLRLLNALYFNLWVHGMSSLRDHFSEIFNPKVGGMRHRKGLNYAFFWLFGLPFRFLKYSSISIIQLMEGYLFVLIDTIFPALTMYHGTSTNSSKAIAKPGKWVVGNGNYAGSGVYFGMSKRVAEYYAQAGQGTVIYARVTLGRILNLSLAPSEVQSCVKYNGDEITRWGRSKFYKSTEWWRVDKGWWEYCLLYPRSKEIRPWRIRIIKVKNVRTGQQERIWGGRRTWLF